MKGLNHCTQCELVSFYYKNLPKAISGFESDFSVINAFLKATLILPQTDYYSKFAVKYFLVATSRKQLENFLVSIFCQFQILFTQSDGYCSKCHQVNWALPYILEK